MHDRILAMVTFAALTAAAGDAAAQSEILSVGDTTGHVHFGWAVSGIGDLDHDGHDDVLVGAPFTMAPTYVRVHSGKDGSILLHIPYVPVPPPASFVPSFGWAVTGPGDLDHDGTPDIVASEGVGTSRVFAFSGQNGALLWTVTGASGESMGRALAPMGDVDGDGTPDVVALFSQGARILSGGNGSVIRQILVLGGSPASISGGVLVDADAVADLAIGIPATGAGRVEVFSGATGALLATIHGAAVGEASGTAVALLGDVTGDGLCEVAIGAINASGVGRVSVATVNTGSVLHSTYGSFSGGDFGRTVARVPDADGDGAPEAAMCSSLELPAGLETEPRGGMTLVSGRTGTVLQHVYGLPFNQANGANNFGCAVAAIGDANGDGRPDVAVGASHEKFGGTAELTGAVHVFSTECGATTFNGAGCPGSGGIVPALAAGGCATPGGEISLTVTKALGGATGLVLLSPSSGPTPLPGGCVLLVDPVLFLALPVPFAGFGPGTGTALLVGELPVGVPLGPFFSQTLVFDPGAGPKGFCASNGIRVTIE